MQCVVCTGHVVHGHGACCDLNCWIISLHKVRSLKDLLSKCVNESRECRMATDKNGQLCGYMPTDIFSMWKCLQDLEEIWY